ncbi:MAG: quinone oxidoreductase [Phenylobacterium zucineum]|nr:MAG: quinone oxidoreductase [Phenylobacterium zucineum]
MRKVEAATLESIADYRLIETPVPAPGAGEVVVQVAACGVGYVDALVALGRYQVKPPLPHTPGQEVGGWIAAVGEGVTGLAAGDRVMATVRGGFGEYAAGPAAGAQKIPDGMDFAQAAGFRINYLTALHGLRDRAAIRPGERLLVLGAAGGVGMAAVQVGKLLGARVIAAASTEEKRAFALANGADAVIDTAAEGWRDRLKALCDGKGPDVVFDPVCGPLFEPAFRSLAWGGRHLVVGFAGGPIPALPSNLTLMKGAALMGVDVRQFLLFEGPRAAAELDELLGWVGEGRLAPPVGRTFTLEDFAPALEFALTGQGMGKTVLSVATERREG